MKKLLALILALVTVCSLFACTAKKNEKPGVTTPEVTTPEVTTPEITTPVLLSMFTSFPKRTTMDVSTACQDTRDT